MPGNFSKKRGTSGLTLFSEIQQDDVSKYRDEGYRCTPLRGWNLSLVWVTRLLMWLHCRWNWFGNRLSPTFRLIRSGIKLRAEGKYSLDLSFVLSVSFNRPFWRSTLNFQRFRHLSFIAYIVLAWLCEVNFSCYIFGKGYSNIDTITSD